ncbi:MAG: CoA-binding protein [Proteobacteria bacterium]|nr:CoA-binding protein [Pseudomonadota bacterium]MBU4470621.1 CoA-binding protein [Pseudomonadota bacterium]MCG2753346.1 CoA-binding protein [Desulfobacteraceae bacterium]
MDAVKSLSPFFEPKGIAIVGARSTPGFGFGLPKNLRDHGWASKTYLVNPNGGTIHGYPVFKTLKEIPAPVDLAVVLVPAPAVPKVLGEIGEHGIKNTIIMSAGFAEAGEEGKTRQAQARKIALSYGMHVIGPNCVGVVNTANEFCTTEVMPEAYTPGRLAVIAQSGVFGQNILERVNEYGIYVSKAVTLGNRLVTNEIHILDYLHKDPDTDTIAMYLEGSADGEQLRHTIVKVTPDKPVIVLKSGRTSEGRAATESHTGSLSGEDNLYDGMFAQTGAIRAETLDDFTTYCRAFATQPLPKGNRLGIITGSGSMGALATDCAIKNGLTVPPLSKRLMAVMKEGAPDWMNTKNPLDVGPSGLFPRAFNAMMEDPDFDMILAVIAVPYSAVRFRLTEFTIEDFFFGGTLPLKERKWEKPFMIAVVCHEDLVSNFRERAEPGTPVFNTPEQPVRALAALWRYQNWKNNHK